jgi:hypothetical protein
LPTTADQTGVGAFVDRQARGAHLRLVVVGGAVPGFAGGEHRQDKGGTEATGQPGQQTAADRRRRQRLPPGKAQTPLPEGAMSLLDGGKPAEHFCELRVGLAVGQRALDRRAIGLVLKIGAIAMSRVTIVHGGSAGGGYQGRDGAASSGSHRAEHLGCWSDRSRHIIGFILLSPAWERGVGEELRELEAPSPSLSPRRGRGT